MATPIAPLFHLLADNSLVHWRPDVGETDKRRMNSSTYAAAAPSTTVKSLVKTKHVVCCYGNFLCRVITEPVSGCVSLAFLARAREANTGRTFSLDDWFHASARECKASFFIHRDQK
jgi:hypothetical protein